MRKILVASLILGIVILSGCQGGQIDLSQVSEKDIDKLIKCDPPYMRFASGCCLDQNDNKVCDADENANKQDTPANKPHSPANIREESIKAPQADKPTSDDIDLVGLYVRGSPEAQITMVEYSDFQCPFCNRFFEQTFPLIEEEYINTGKVRFFYKHLPLVIHPDARKAAEAAECAGEQVKFWEMHDVLFENQGALTVPDLKKYAGEIGLDVQKFNSCLDSDKMAYTVNKHNAEAARVGASGTPTFFINSQRVVGAQPYPVFEAAIEAELAK